MQEIRNRKLGNLKIQIFKSTFRLTWKDYYKIESRLREERKVIDMLNSVLLSKHFVNKTWTFILISFIVLHGAETRAISRQNGNKLLAIEMEVWRKTAMKSRKGIVIQTEAYRN